MHRRLWTLDDPALNACCSADALAAALRARASSHASWSIDVSLFDQRVAAVGGAPEAMERCAEALAAAAAEAQLRALDVTLCPNVSFGTNASLGTHALGTNGSSGDVFLRALAAARPTLDALGVRGAVGGGGGESLAALLSPSLRRFALDLSAVPRGENKENKENEGNKESEGALRLLRAAVSQCGALSHVSVCGGGTLRALLSSPLPPRLHSLDVRSAAVDDAGAFALASALVPCGAQLAVLQLRHNRIGRDGAAAVASVCRALRYLSLHTNLLGDDGLRGVLRHAPQWAELRGLDLTRCRITTRALPDMALALAHAPRLEALVLDRNDLRLTQPGLHKERCANESGESSESGEDGAGLFAYGAAYMSPRGDAKVPTSYEIERRDAQSGRRRYTGLNKGGGGVAEDSNREGEGGRAEECGEKAFGLLGAALSECRGLRHLSLADCALCDAALAALSARLTAPRLASLRLSANPLFARGAGAEALAALLRGAAPSLRALDVSCTSLRSGGVALLADGPDGDVSRAALRGLCALAELRLSFCRVGPDGFEALADALPGAAALQRISLDGNEVLDDDAAHGLLEALGKMPAIAFVALNGSVPASAAASPECAALRRRGVAVHI